MMTKKKFKNYRKKIAVVRSSSVREEFVRESQEGFLMAITL